MQVIFLCDHYHPCKNDVAICAMLPGATPGFIFSCGQKAELVVL